MRTSFALLCLGWITSSAFAAQVRLLSADFIGGDEVKAVRLSFDRTLRKPPVLNVKDKKIQISIPDGVVWPRMEKRISLLGDKDTTLLGYQFDKNMARFRILLPYETTGMKDRISVDLKGRSVKISFPVPLTLGTRATNKYDESYLKKLITEEARKKAARKPAEVPISPVLKGDDDFSLIATIAKFTVFLLLVLALFYAIVNFLKRSVFQKSKLGFLNSTKVVEVINTTYISPKRSVVLVRAHNQVFIIGNSEKGLHNLGEVTNLAGLLKDGEKNLSGNNFDTLMEESKKVEEKVKLKDALGTQEGKVKLSEQIKNKVKSLKPLQ